MSTRRTCTYPPSCSTRRRRCCRCRSRSAPRSPVRRRGSRSSSNSAPDPDAPDRAIAMTHIVEGPCRVWLREPDVDGDEVVEVECDDGTRTLVYFGRLPVELQLPLPRP